MIGYLIEKYRILKNRMEADPAFEETAVKEVRTFFFYTTIGMLIGLVYLIIKTKYF